MELANSLLNLGKLLRGQSRIDEAERNIRRAVDLNEALAAMGSPEPEYQQSRQKAGTTWQC